MMKKLMPLFALGLALSATAPVFAHDNHPSYSDRAVAGRTNASVSAFDLNRDGRVSPYEVRRVKEDRRRDELRRDRAAIRIRAAVRARAAYVASIRDARYQDHHDHHFDAPRSYR